MPKEIRFRCGTCKQTFKRATGISSEVLIITGEEGKGYERWGDVCKKCREKIESFVKSLVK